MKFGWGECPYISKEYKTARIRVVDASSNPIQGASVVIRGKTADQETYRAEDTTDSKGEVSQVLPKGDYVIEVTKKGWLSAKQKLSKWDGEQKINDIRLGSYARVITEPVVVGKEEQVTENYAKCYIEKVIIEDYGYTNGKSIFDGAVIESVEIKETVGVIASNLFRGSTIGSITIPDNVVSIGKYAFQSAILPQDFALGSGLRVVDFCAFDDCDVEIPCLVIEDGMYLRNAFTNLKVKEVILNGSANTSFYAPLYGATIEKVTISSNVSVIPADIFCGSTIKEITIPSNITEIGNQAFYQATLPSDFYVSDSVKLGYNVFLDSNYNYVIPEAEIMAISVSASKTVTLTDLRPNDIYNFYVMAEKEEFMETGKLLDGDNLLYVIQFATDADGRAEITYVPRKYVEGAVEVTACMSRYDIGGAEIEVEDISYDGQSHEVSPSVSYGGQVLAEGEDYELAGDWQVTDAGTYSITVNGVNDYSGSVSAAFRVVKEGEEPDDNPSDNLDDNPSDNPSDTPGEVENPFGDIREKDWYYPYVMFVYSHELMGGKGKMADGTLKFDPANTITRAEFVQMLYSKENKPDVTYKAVFADVPDGQWYTNAILWAAQEEIVGGDHDAGIHDGIRNGDRVV